MIHNIIDFEVQGTKKSEPTLEKTKKALEKLGNPQEEYEIILVGGTNGKGSTTEMISELLQANGYKVGVNKSPHLESPTERVKVNSKEINEKRIQELARNIMDKSPDLSFFELLTVIAYRYFSENNVDYAVMEVGMGGRLDATNAAENSTAVITNIDRDHQKYLGESKEEIGEEIAGIIPENGDLVTGSDLGSVKEKSRKMETKIHRPDVLNRFNGEVFFQGETFQLPVKGRFQIENLSNALKTVERTTGLPESIGPGLENVECRGRLQKISEKPLVIFDGAHNTPAIERITEEVPDNLVCVFSCTESKDADEMIAKLEEKVSEFVFTRPEIEWAEEPSELADITEKKSEIIEDPETAVSEAEKLAGKNGAVLVTGSLYLIGDVLSELDR